MQQMLQLHLVVLLFFVTTYILYAKSVEDEKRQNDDRQVSFQKSILRPHLKHLKHPRSGEVHGDLKFRSRSKDLKDLKDPRSGEVHGDLKFRSERL